MFQDHSHHPEDIAQRIEEGPKALYLREWVYGGIDGVVTTFAIIAAVVGASMSPLVVIIMGVANLLADGFSMAASAYSAASADEENYKRLYKREVSHVENHPEGEIEETRQILKTKGYSEEEIKEMLPMITKDKERWIDFMMVEEYGLSALKLSPFMVGFHTLLAFILCGAMPLWPYIFNLGMPHIWSFVLAGLTFFGIGSLKSLWSVRPWWLEGGITLAVGSAAASLAFFVGWGLQSLV